MILPGKPKTKDEEGETIRAPGLKMALAVWAVCSALCATAFGQGLDLSLDLNTPASHARSKPGSESLDVNAEVGLSLSYYSRLLFDHGACSRWGIVVGRQGLAVSPVRVGGESVSYTTFNVQAGFDWRVVGNSHLNLSAGILETRGSVYMTDRESTFPFKSGVIVAVGLDVLSVPRGKTGFDSR